MPLMSTSLALPWEVIERIIEHASNDINLLRNFSLTCRQLRPCSSSLILAHHVFLDSRDRVSDLSDFLLQTPELRPLIRSITISPAEFRPFPLVNMLPHLSTLTFVSCKCKNHVGSKVRPEVVLHPNTLTCYHLFGKRIRTLSLEHLSFKTSFDLFRLILAFPETTKLVVYDVVVKFPGNDTLTMKLMKTKLGDRLRLETLNVRIHSEIICDPIHPVG